MQSEVYFMHFSNLQLVSTEKTEAGIQHHSHDSKAAVSISNISTDTERVAPSYSHMLLTHQALHAFRICSYTVMTLSR